MLNVQLVCTCKIMYINVQMLSCISDCEYYFFCFISEHKHQIKHNNDFWVPLWIFIIILDVKHNNNSVSELQQLPAKCFLMFLSHCLQTLRVSSGDTQTCSLFAGCLLSLYISPHTTF